MKISDVLLSVASWLEDPNNEALVMAEHDDECLAAVASYCVEAATALRKGAEEIQTLLSPEKSVITAESLDGLVDLATAFDASDNALLKKQASLIDELLVTISAPPNAVAQKKAEMNNEIDSFKKKFQNANQELGEKNKTADALKDIEDSGVTKQYRSLEAPLNTRYCPDHPGAQIRRIDDNVWQCDLDKKQYDFESGFTLMDGSKVPGGSVSNQTQIGSGDYNEFSMFDSREGRLSTNTP